MPPAPGAFCLERQLPNPHDSLAARCEGVRGHSANHDEIAARRNPPGVPSTLSLKRLGVLLTAPASSLKRFGRCACRSNIRNIWRRSATPSKTLRMAVGVMGRLLVRRRAEARLTSSASPSSSALRALPAAASPSGGVKGRETRAKLPLTPPAGMRQPVAPSFLPASPLPLSPAAWHSSPSGRAASAQSRIRS